MIIDFRLRPPVGGFLNTLMYSAGARRDGFTRTVGFTPSPAAQQQSMDLLLEEMEAAGVDAGVVVGRLAGVLGSVPNEDVRQIVAAHPGRFIGAASIDPTDRRRMPDHRPGAGGRLQADQYRAGFLPRADACRRPAAVSDLWPLRGRGRARHHDGGRHGRADLSYSDPIRTDRVLADFPNLNVVVAHGGWPWVNEILHLGFRRQNLWLSPDMYFSRMPGWEEYVKAADGFLSDRMLYASSFPFCPVREYKSWFESLPIKEENLRKIMGGNARRLLGIPARNP